MRGLRLVLNAAGALGLMLAAFEILAAPGARYFPAARAEGPAWTASMQGVPAAQGAQQPKAQAAPASVPASLPSNAAVPAVAVSPQKPAAPPSMKKANARELFGAAKEPANLAARSIGFYAHGCLAGGKPLPVNGSAWQVMRLSRNRNWGHPSLIRYIERFAQDAKEKDGWPGLLVGDLSMPRGGPMPLRSCQPSGRPRRRYLVQAHARSRAFRRGAGEHKNGKLSARPRPCEPGGLEARI